jgi:hypothetical protein
MSDASRLVDLLTGQAASLPPEARFGPTAGRASLPRILEATFSRVRPNLDLETVSAPSSTRPCGRQNSPFLYGTKIAFRNERRCVQGHRELQKVLSANL